MAQKTVAPSVSATAFNCPHCGTLTTQYWLRLMADQLGRDKLPVVWKPEDIQNAIDGYEVGQREQGAEVDPAEIEKFRNYAEKGVEGVVYLEASSRGYHDHLVHNLHLSRCYECDKLSIWQYDRLLWPSNSAAPEPSPDLPKTVILEYREAAAVLPASPRGAAALLRLCIELLCHHLLGDASKDDLNADIGQLVGRGLDPRVQMALDVVRVIGNEAVHPGVIDLRDDSETALELFGLVNLITEIMITQPKHIAEMYAGLPQGKLEAIEHRNIRALAPPKSES